MLETKIYWNIHDHCQAGCSYCPSRFWGGNINHSIEEYMNVLKTIVSHYTEMNRKINWIFNGGEPLELFDFPMMLKYCKTNGGTIQIHSNGGRLWLDWWALEPNIDKLILTYHYWQNRKLIDFIIQTFQKNNKIVDVVVPIRPNHFDYDINRAVEIEKTYGILVSKSQLYKDASTVTGMFDYTDTQLKIMKGEQLIEENIQYKTKTFEQRVELMIKDNDSFTGQLCNSGVEYLQISHNGYIKGSNCNNTHLGNIWNGSFSLPAGPTLCKMIACTNEEDKLITKFP